MAFSSGMLRLQMMHGQVLGGEQRVICQQMHTAFPPASLRLCTTCKACAHPESTADALQMHCSPAPCTASFPTPAGDCA